MQTQFDKAIYDHINGSVALKALLGDERFYADNAPQDTVFPYLAWTWILIPHEETFTSEIENASLQFSIFSKNQSVAEVDEIADELFDLFDNATISIDDYNFMRCRRVSARRVKDPENAWHHMTEYQLLACR